MRRNREQRLRHFNAYIRLVKVIEVLRGEDHSRFLLAHALEAVADVLYRRGGYFSRIYSSSKAWRVALGQKLVGHITKDVEDMAF